MQFHCYVNTERFSGGTNAFLGSEPALFLRRGTLIRAGPIDDLSARYRTGSEIGMSCGLFGTVFRMFFESKSEKIKKKICVVRNLPTSVQYIGDLYRWIPHESSDDYDVSNTQIYTCLSCEFGRVSTGLDVVMRPILPTMILTK